MLPVFVMTAVAPEVTDTAVNLPWIVPALVTVTFAAAA